MSTRLRPATAEDWPAIAALLARHDLPLAGASEHLEDFIVAVDVDGGVVGVGGLERYGAVALLRSLAVASPGDGVGTRIVDHLRQEAHASGVRELVLLTTTAAPFFARLGFRELTRAHVPAALRASAEFQGACPESALAMHLVLTPTPDSSR